jgi:hypothetical protein
MSKLELVRYVLAQHPQIRSWYVEQHGLDESALTHESVRTYGTGGHGDIADSILSDAITAQ